ncbi:response regulator transcription factor [Alkalimarinus coralli]|uniref:response regulator transcription factor n=1 Tax=Alkalimarinus coralli TaxID=2935863 RepID=UPI00202ACDCE|nr:helix-turn-helix transcriptional regulator [Alkalimarinus coralli]
MFGDKDAEFISKFIANNVEGKEKRSVVSLLNSLNQRILINKVNYQIFQKDTVTGEYSCLEYIYQKSSGLFAFAQFKEQDWNTEQTNTHCLSCQKITQSLMHANVSRYVIHEHPDGLQAIKVDLPDQLTGLRAVYSLQFSMSGHKVESSDKLILRCLLPVLFYAARQVRADMNGEDILTNREIAVLEWVKQGKSTWDISQVLSITERTVNFHVKNIYRKLGVVSRAQAVAVAIDLGLIESFVVRGDSVSIE